MADDGRTGQDDRNRTDGNPLKEETKGGRRAFSEKLKWGGGEHQPVHISLKAGKYNTPGRVLDCPI